MKHFIKMHAKYLLWVYLLFPLQLHADCTALIQKDPKLPVEITKSGYYCITKDIYFRDYTRCAIEIKTNNVIVDLKSHTLIGAPTEQVVGPTIGGVCAETKRYITVRNGTIRNFDVGVQFDLSTSSPFLSGHLIENMTFISNVNSIILGGSDNVIRNNRIYPGKKGGGISLYGKRNFVTSNILYSSGMHVGDDSIVENNRIIGGSIGVAVGAQKNTAIIGNVLINSQGGIWLTNGVLRDNILVNPKIGYSLDKPNQIIDGGGNIPALPK